ncbi:glycosyltransferase family 2 protein [Aquimarina sp. ERC-38]|uniref:glycosyltransferase family 2 protein n=1 Tax=Aquimarina sp. ERC-38 TaxID=2949996 RepID=UPI0022464C63|nr:glycosyltransferase family 2 protein [Aquimarina sp. ERC-38]UZO79799.1 glycosyltransferase family 2 protein [Aquimarina sp. ERC-38]
MRIAVAILNWNGKNLLKKFLPRVVQYSPDASVYVIDNASTDDSVDFIAVNYPEVTIVQNQENGGYAEGYNKGILKIDAEIICLLNSDIEVTKNWLKPIISLYNKDKRISVVQPKILDYKSKNRFEYAGAAGGFIDRLGYPYCRGRIFETTEKDYGQYDQSGSIFWASGSCFFIKKADFLKMDGFDEDFFAHQEEIDLCWRLFNKGYSIFYEADSCVYHVGGATLSTQDPRKTYLNFRNNLYLLVKNGPSHVYPFIILIRMVLDGIAGIKFLFSGQGSHMWAILKAHGSFYKNFPKFVKKRSKASQKIKYYQINSVVWQYYVLGRKTYNKIKGINL